MPITLETVGGNHVVLDLGGGCQRSTLIFNRAAFASRLVTMSRGPGHRPVNSGNSTEPHLHFHISDGVSPLGSEGLPYALAGMPGMPLQNERVTFKR